MKELLLFAAPALVLAAGAVAAPSPSTLAPAPQQAGEATFHRAYYLEREGGSLEEALALYREVVADARTASALRERAAVRIEALAEDLASSDLARLMPPDPILYVELDGPGASLERVLRELGLVGSFDEAAESGTLRVRPEVLRSLLGVRGAALAVTRLPEAGGTPGGVLVLNPGDVEALRGLIETSVLAQGTQTAPIEGVPTWSLEEQVLVSVSARLVVASTEREEIAGVLRRLGGSEEPSLASNDALREELALRADAPLYCLLSAAPLRPLLGTLLASATAGKPELALAAAALDPMHARSVVARLEVGEDTLALDADLFLEADHRNLVFNLLRRSSLDPATLDRIPAGAAFFAAGAFNERGSSLVPLERNADGAPVVTLLDFGRELFANLAGYSLFVLPGGAPIPRAALVLSSNDPARTGAVLGLLLGMGNTLTGGQPMEGGAHEIAGAPTRVFHLPPGIPLYLTTHENDLILSASEEVIEEALEGRASGSSVLFDEAFASQLGRLQPGTTMAVQAHLGRTLEVLSPFIGGSQREQLAQVAPLVADTVVALQARHSATRFGLGLTARGLPRVDGLLSQALKHARTDARSLTRVQPVGLQAGFARIAVRPGAEDEARAFALEQLRLLKDDPRTLNNFAWMLLTDEPFPGRYDDLAATFAEASVEASGGSVWQYLDTLALARFRAGMLQEAVHLQERALALVEDAGDRATLEESLARFRKAAGDLAAGQETPPH